MTGIDRRQLLALREPLRKASGSLARRAATASAVAVLAVPVLLAAPAAANAGTVSSVLAADAMSRQTSTGWGTADQGGPWTSWVGAPSTMSMGGGYGVMGLSPGASALAQLGSVTAADSTSTMNFLLAALPPAPASSYVALWQRDSAGSHYEGRVQVKSDGSATLSLVRQDGSASSLTALGAPQPLAGIVAGRPFRLQVTVSGTGPVGLSAEAWPDASSAASQPPVTVTASDGSASALSGSGSPAVWSYLSGSAGSPPGAFTVQATQFLLTTPQPGPGSTSGPSRPIIPRVAASDPDPIVRNPIALAGPTPAPAPTGSAPSDPVPTGGSGSPAPSGSSSPVSGAPTSPPAGTVGAPPANPPTPGNPAATAGSLAVGSASYPVAAGALFVSPTAGSDTNPGSQAAPLRTVVAAVAAASTGQVIVLRGGVYHESVFLPANKSLTIQAYPGEAVWFDGSTAVTNWVQQGSTWVSSGWKANFDHSASFSTGHNDPSFINPAYPMAAYPDQVFVDGTQLAQVPAGTIPGPGQFAVDTVRQTITIGTDPAGHQIRSSDLQQAFLIAGRSTLLGFGVRRYATSLPQMGTIFLGGQAGGSILQNLVIDNNATQGLSICVPLVLADHITASNNGITGIHGNQLDGSTISNSLAFGNNREHFNTWPSAGDIKITRSRGVTITGNDVSSAGTLGIWLDESVVGFTIAGNYVHGPVEYGILVELSDTGLVAGNVVRNAKRGMTALDSANVRVYNNLLGDNSLWDVGLQQDARRQANAADPGHDPRQPIPDPTNTWVVKNIMVANNVFGARVANASQVYQFYSLDNQTNIPADAMAITISGNLFAARGSSYAVVGWGGSDNRTVASITDPDTFAAARGLSWHNLVAGSTTSAAMAATTTGVALPVPADVAAALGVAAGTAQLGPFTTW